MLFYNNLKKYFLKREYNISRKKLFTLKRITIMNNNIILHYIHVI